MPKKKKWNLHNMTHVNNNKLVNKRTAFKFCHCWNIKGKSYYKTTTLLDTEKPLLFLPKASRWYGHKNWNFWHKVSNTYEIQALKRQVRSYKNNFDVSILWLVPISWLYPFFDGTFMSSHLLPKNWTTLIHHLSFDEHEKGASRESPLQIFKSRLSVAFIA